MTDIADSPLSSASVIIRPVLIITMAALYESFTYPGNR